MAVAMLATHQKCCHTYYSQIDLGLWLLCRWFTNDYSLDLFDSWFQKVPGEAGLG